MDYRYRKTAGVPTGIWIVLDYDEAADLTERENVVEIMSALAGKIPQPWGTLVAAAIGSQLSHIRALNESSGGKGVELFFDPLVGMITTVHRRGFPLSSNPERSTAGGRRGTSGRIRAK